MKGLAMPRHFGVLIPSTNTTVEIEYNRLLPAEYQAHVGRLKSSGGTPFAPSIDAEVDYQAKLLGTAKVEVICLSQTSASLFADDYDADVVRRMSAEAGAPAVTSAQAIGEAVRALGASRIALASPYSQEVIERAGRYYATKFGLQVLGLHSFGATDAYMIGKRARTMRATRSGESIGRRSRRWSCRAGIFRRWRLCRSGSGSSANR